MTPATKDLINILIGPLEPAKSIIETLDYNETLQHDQEQITFFKADHILGSAQVLVEDVEGKRIVYTGDFKIDETPVIESDVLVVEATYGNPACKRSFSANIKEQLVSTVEQGLKHETVYVFGYHGKLQEVMQILRTAGVKAPYITSERILQFSKACEKNGMRLGKIISSEHEEAQELLKRQTPCVAFYHMNTKTKIGIGRFRICVSGWEFDAPIRETANKEYVVALSDHSDFDGLMEYVKRSKPKFVVTDNYRVGYAEVFAKEIRTRLGISAVALPQSATPPDNTNALLPMFV